MLTSTIPMQEGTREVVLPACCSISRMPCWRVQRGRCRATGGRVGGGSGAGRWVALWRQLLDRLNVVAEAERRGLRPIGPGGYTGGECYRALVKPCSPAGTSCPTGRCWPTRPPPRCGGNALPSVCKSAALWRFLAGGDLGRVTKAAATNRALLSRAWAAAMAAGGAPDVTGSFITALAYGLFALTAYASGVLISQLSTSARSGTALAVQFRRACTYSPTSRMNSDPSAWSGSSPPSTTSTPPVR